MAIKITLGNAKGGVGKTIVTNLLAHQLAEKKYKVLIVDIDPQGNTTSLFERKYYSKDYDFPTLYDGLQKEDLKSIIQMPTEDLHFIASSLDTVNLSKVLTPKNKVMYLKKYIEKIEEDYDFIFYDVPPTTYSDFLNNALGASDYFIIITETSNHSFDGISKFYDAANQIHEGFNEKLDFLGVLINRREKDKETFSKLDEEYQFKEDEMFFTNFIPQRTRITKYSEYGIYNYPYSKNTVLGYDKWDLEVKKYAELLCNELLEKVKG